MPNRSLSRVDPAERMLDWLVPPQTPIHIKQPGHFPGPYGPVWDLCAPIVQQIIEEHNIPSMNEIALNLKSRPEHKELHELVLKWINPKGGNRLPHFHYKGEVYPVSPTEWTEFSKAAVMKLQQKFTANIGSISYENQCMAISSMME